MDCVDGSDAIDAATRHARAPPRQQTAASMFRKFTKEDHIKSASAVRSSDQRSIRALILEQYPALEPFIEDIFPKKDSLIVCKCQNYLQVLLDPKGEFIFFQCRQGPYIPTLRFLHKCTPCAAAFKRDAMMHLSLSISHALLLSLHARRPRHFAKIHGGPRRGALYIERRQHHGARPHEHRKGRRDG